MRLLLRISAILIENQGIYYVKVFCGLFENTLEIVKHIKLNGSKMNIVEEDEMVKLLDVKDVENESIKEHYESEVIENDTETVEVTNNDSIGSNSSCIERRSDEPAELSFEKGDEIILDALFNYYLCREIITDSSK